jgi:DNA mismatch repair protein MutS
VLSSQSKALAREKELYEGILNHLCARLKELQLMASAIATIDVLNNLAERAVTFKLVRPEFSNDVKLSIKAGRHPVIENVADTLFVPNDIELHHDRRLLVITGPNMGGKSTYMRQTALIVILAHIGSFVPAESAIIGSIDRIFTRVGASDDLANGRSTFMVEMTEAANILNNASENSLIIMDEIGRGTSTFDGLSLAFACASYLASHVKALTLFATHYFELTSLPQACPACVNIHFDAMEHNDNIVFLHTVNEGPANKSYGLQVAQLAGIPKNVIMEAKKKLANLESNGNREADLPATDIVFESSFNDCDKFEHPVISKLKTVDPNALTPKEAMAILYDLKKILESEE